MSEQPEALRLADALNEKPDSDGHCREAAAELRRLHEVNQQLLDALKEIADGASSEFEDAWCGEIARAAITKGEQA